MSIIMLLDKKETTIAYRCPECGASLISPVSIFALSGDMLRLKCTCGGSTLTITRKSDGKLRLSVPCIACPKPHNFTLGQKAFFERQDDVFSLPCPYTSLDTCFIGKEKDVSKALDKANEELEAMMRRAELDDLAKIRGEENDDDLKSENPLIDDIVFYMIKELEDEGKIHCRCNDGEGEYTYRLHHGRVTVTCEECGAMLTMQMEGTDAATRFLECDSLTLE